MCQHRSYVVTEDMKVLSSKYDDHHTTIRREYGIPDNFHSRIENTSVEFIPRTSLHNLEGWNFGFDDKKPGWWKDEHMVKVVDKLKSEHLRFAVNDSTYVFPGSLDLNSLETLDRSGITIVAKGDIFLNSLRVLPPDTVLIARGTGVQLRSLRDVYPGCTVVADRVIVHPSIEKKLQSPDTEHTSYSKRRGILFEEEMIDPAKYYQMIRDFAIKP